MKRKLKPKLSSFFGGFQGFSWWYFWFFWWFSWFLYGGFSFQINIFFCKKNISNRETMIGNVP